MKRAVFLSYNTDNPQINCISLNDRYSELFSGRKKLPSGDDFSFRFAPFSSSSLSNWRAHFFDVISSGSIYFKHQRGFNPEYMFRHHDVSFKIVIWIASKRFNPKYMFRHHDVSFKIVIWIASKNICRKTMTTKIWSWKLDKCSGIIKPCLHAYFI